MLSLEAIATLKEWVGLSESAAVACALLTIANSEPIATDRSRVGLMGLDPQLRRHAELGVGPTGLSRRVGRRSTGHLTVTIALAQPIVSRYNEQKARRDR